MADISLQAAHDFWRNYEDGSVYRILSFMESVEHWVVDGDESVETALNQLADKLDILQRIHMDEFTQYEFVINILSNIKSTRAMYITYLLDRAIPGCAFNMLTYAEENARELTDPFGVYVSRNITFERLRLLSRVFSNERVEMIMSAVEKEEEQ